MKNFYFKGSNLGQANWLKRWTEMMFSVLMMSGVQSNLLVFTSETQILIMAVFNILIFFLGTISWKRASFLNGGVFIFQWVVVVVVVGGGVFILRCVAPHGGGICLSVLMMRFQKIH